MFEVKHIRNKTSNFLELQHSHESTFARIDLNLGGSLQDLVLGGKTIISSEKTLPYDVSYASAILFPFANRIEGGEYSYDNKDYQLKINKPDEGNSIHGLVYDKTFEFVHSSFNTDLATIHIRYINDKEEKGFPFNYILTLTYVLKKDVLKLIVEIKNSGNSTFPFTIGWHPYFNTQDLSKTILDIEQIHKVMVDDRKIPLKENTLIKQETLDITNGTIDDCFFTDSDTVFLGTPKYQVSLKYSPSIKYIQVYTPKDRQSVALEPQTGPANSFNNGLGLQSLEPNGHRNFCWTIRLQT